MTTNKPVTKAVWKIKLKEESQDNWIETWEFESREKAARYMYELLDEDGERVFDASTFEINLVEGTK